MAKNTEKTTPVTEEAAVVKETPVVEPAKTTVEETPKKEAAPAKAEAKAPKNTPELIVGRTKVTLKESCKETVVGLPIPEFAYRNTYLIKAVLADRVIIGIDLYDGYCLPVTENDIDIIVGE